jgi:hypothetical protein
MIFAGKLSIVDFNFGFRRSESETKNREWLEYAASNLYAEILIVEPLNWIVLSRGGRIELQSLLFVRRGGSPRRGGVLVLSSPMWSFVAMALSISVTVIAACIAAVLIIFVIICVVIWRALSVSSSSWAPRWQRSPLFGSLW